MHPDDYKKPFSFAESPEKLTVKAVFPPWCGIFKRKFLVEWGIRFDAMPSFNDHSFYFAAAIRAERVMVADVYVVNHRLNNPNSLQGKALSRIIGRFETYKTIYEDSIFLPRKHLAFVLSAELEGIFDYYNIASEQDVRSEKARKAMSDFVRNLDIDLLKGVCEKAIWYPDYLILKLEMGTEEGILSEQEKEDLLLKIKDSLWSTLPFPLNGTQIRSKVILYGAGKFGTKIYHVLQKSRYFNVVDWVDTDWASKAELSQSVSSPDSIRNTEYDFVLIAIKATKAVFEVQLLLTKLGVPPDKIISPIGCEPSHLIATEKERLFSRLRRFFPPEQLESIQLGSKIILYGAGKIGEKAYNMLQKTRYCQAVAWVDSDWTAKTEDNPIISSPDDIGHVEHDFILIAIKAPSAVFEVQRRLVKMGIPDNKVILHIDVDSCAFINAEKEKFHRILCRAYSSEQLEKINIGSKLILYGAGKFGQKIYSALQKTVYCQVIEWVDRDWMLKKDELPVVSNPDTISNTDYDFILIAIKAQKIADEVKQWLSEMGVPAGKIMMIIGEDWQE